ncbi:MAG: DMT family transporter [Candidatus Binatia bacterium]
MLPIAYGILTSLCFAAGSLLAQRGFHSALTPWGAWITVAVNTVFLFAFHFVLYSETSLFIAENLVFVMIGLFVPGLTRVLTFRGIRTVGSTITSTIVNTTPMFSTLLAMSLLGERPGRLVLFGGFLIVAGLIIVSWVGEQRLWNRMELVYPFSAVFLFATKDVTVRWGLAGGGQPILAAAIAALTSTVEIYVLTRYLQGVKFSPPARAAACWFVASGIFTGASFLFMYLALSMERVSTIAPLINSYAVFVLVLTPLMARRIEIITWRKALGAALVVAGIFLISFGRE